MIDREEWSWRHFRNSKKILYPYNKLNINTNFKNTPHAQKKLESKNPNSARIHYPRQGNRSLPRRQHALHRPKPRHRAGTAGILRAGSTRPESPQATRSGNRSLCDQPCSRTGNLRASAAGIPKKETILQIFRTIFPDNAPTFSILPYFCLFAEPCPDTLPTHENP